jgi:hypothetical protein
MVSPPPHPPRQPVVPVVDAELEQNVVSTLLHLASAAIGDRPHTTVRVGYSDVRSGSLFSISALIVAPPLWTVVEYRIGRQDADAVAQTFHLDQVVEVVSSGGNTYAVVQAPLVDSSTIGFQVEGPLISLPHHTPAHELLDPVRR